MAEREFNVQVMETKAQWESGLRNRLALDGNGLSLFVNPAFESWLVKDDWKAGAGDIVVDECGQTYWTALRQRRDGSRVWTLYRHNPTTNQIERVLSFAGCGKIEPRKLWLSGELLWIFDQHDTGTSDLSGKGRMLVMSRHNSQILHEVTLENLIDLDVDKRGFFYTLVRENDKVRICRHSVAPLTLDQVECVNNRKRWDPLVRSTWGPQGKKKCWQRNWPAPVKIAVGRMGHLYILDTELGRIVRFNPETEEETQLGAPKEKLLVAFKPSVMEIDARGVIFLASAYEPAKPGKPEKPATLHMFDEDGSYLGQVELPSSVKRIDGIGFDRNGGIYLATDRGLARFSLSNNPVGHDGVFYSKTLDNGTPQSFWHRIALKGQVPLKASVEVYYHTSDSEALKAAFDEALGGAGSVEERTVKIENLLGPKWAQPPQVFTGAEFQAPTDPGAADSLVEKPATPDLILDPNQGRFLWFKLRLITFDHKIRPSINSARIFYPRLSYLRYLPPVYREEKMSAAFLERFLSLFETVFDGLDQEIDQLFRYFDPRSAPKEFLPWLCSWINLTLDDDVPEERVRRFIRRSPFLFSRKGTPEALDEFLEIYTGRPVFLIEHSRGLKPLILGGPDFRLGNGTILLGSGPRGMRVGDTSVVGYSALRDRVSDPDEPFLPLARRFSVVVDMPREEFQKRMSTLQRIVDEQKPAHTSCTIRLGADQGTVGTAVLGVGGNITDTQPYRVGKTPLGAASAIARGPRALRLERGAWVGSSTRL